MAKLKCWFRTLSQLKLIKSVRITNNFTFNQAFLFLMNESEFCAPSQAAANFWGQLFKIKDVVRILTFYQQKITVCLLT